MIRAVIIDDEKAGREILRNLSQKYCSGIVEIAGEADSVFSGKEVLEQTRPDLVFLDVQMQDGTGFDLLEMLSEITFSVIFVTSYDKFAIRAFKYNAVDYLLKPVDPDLLAAAVGRVKLQHNPAENHARYKTLSGNHQNPEKIALPGSDGIRFVKVDDIMRCESDSNYTTIFTVNREKIMVSRTLKEYEDMLEGTGFFRVHKSHLVNLKYVDKYIPGEGGYLILEDKTQVMVSRRKKESLLEILMRR